MAKSAVTKSRLAKSMNDTIKKLKVSDDMVVDQSGIRFIYVDYKESVDDAVDKVISSLRRTYGIDRVYNCLLYTSPSPRD